MCSSRRQAFVNASIEAVAGNCLDAVRKHAIGKRASIEIFVCRCEVEDTDAIEDLLFERCAVLDGDSSTFESPGPPG